MLWPILAQKNASPSRSVTSIYKMEKPQNLTTRQYMGLIRDLNPRMAHIILLFNDTQELDECKLVDYLANKAPWIHKAMMISQGFNIETWDFATSVEHCKHDETTDNISMVKFYASDEDSDTKKNKKNSKKTKEREDSGRERRKNSSRYCSLHGEKK